MFLRVLARMAARIVWGSLARLIRRVVSKKVGLELSRLPYKTAFFQGATIQWALYGSPTMATMTPSPLRNVKSSTTQILFTIGSSVPVQGP